LRSLHGISYSYESSDRYVKERTPSKATFTAAMQSYLIRALMKQADSGKKADIGFKKEAWHQVLKKFNEKFAVMYTVDKLKNKHDNVRYRCIFC
jgi:hypothetical protein